MVRCNNFRFLINFITKVRAVNRENGSYHRIVKEIAAREISIAHELNDGSIGHLHFLKMQWYMATNLYLGELLAGLRPQKMNQKEKLSVVYLGALMAITDLMVDDFKVAPERLTRLLKGDYNTAGDTSAIEHIFIMFHQKLLTDIDKEKRAHITDFSLRKPQVESHLQTTSPLGKAEIDNITRNKGGAAVLLTASLLFQITEDKRKVFYQLGAFIQYLNDSQDIYKDTMAGVQTFVSYCNTFDEVNQKLFEELTLTKVLFSASEFSDRKIYELLFYIHAMYIGIMYKNKELARSIGNSIGFDKFLLMKKTTFEIQLFSMRSIIFSTPKILAFNCQIEK